MCVHVMLQFGPCNLLKAERPDMIKQSIQRGKPNRVHLDKRGIKIAFYDLHTSKNFRILGTLLATCKLDNLVS